MSKLEIVSRFGSILTATEITHMVGEPVVFASMSSNVGAWMLAFPDGSAMFAPYGATGYGSYYSNHAATVNDWQTQGVSLCANIALNSLGYMRSLPIIEHRFGIPLLEITHCVADGTGHGVDQFGSINADPIEGIGKGVEYTTLYFWNPCNNYNDDVLWRTDIFDYDANNAQKWNDWAQNVVWEGGE